MPDIVRKDKTGLPPHYHFDRSLFSDTFLQVLFHNKWLYKKKIGRKPNQSSAPAKGSGNEDFLCHQAYTEGEDIRYLDWALYGRSEQLFIKKFAAPTSGYFEILIDVSASMGVGHPIKLELALQLGAAIAYLSLQNGSEVRLGLLLPTQILYSKPVCSLFRFYEILEFLSWQRPQGKVILHQLLAQVPQRPRRTCILITDLLDAGGCETYFRLLAGKGYPIGIFHLMHPEEINPPWRGAVSLYDVESEQHQYRYLDENSINAYRERFTRFQKYWQSFCSQYQLHYVFASSDKPFLPVLLEGLSWLGWQR